MGAHRARAKGTTYTYKSHVTKKYERKANKHYQRANNSKEHSKAVAEKAKADKYANRAKRSAQLDTKEQKQSLSRSTAATIGIRALNYHAFMYSKSYQRYRALGDSKVRAIIKSGSFNYPLSMITKANYIRGRGRYARKELKNNVK